MQVERPLENANGLLFDETHTVIVYGQRRSIRFEGATGIMLSNSPQAGYCMVASAEREGLELIAVVLNAAPASAYEDTMEMFEYGFNNFAQLTVMTKGKEGGKIAVEGGQEKEVSLVFAADVQAIVAKGLTAADVEIRTEIPISLPAPVAEGDLVGKAEAWLGDTKIGETDLVAGAGVDKAAIKKFFSASGKVVSIVVKVVLAIIALLVVWVIVMVISAEARKRSRKRRRYGVDTHGTREVKRIRRIR
jgi:D-alanyl-D-alanine carboxypeptidase (penicillin-binding protein 5/6)